MRECTPEDVRDGRAEWSITTGDGPAGLLELGRVDHVVTDPPYEAESHTKGWRVAREGESTRRTAVLVPLSLDFAPMTPELRTMAGIAIAATCRPWALVFCQNDAAHLWRRALAMPLRYIREGVWIKTDAQPQMSGDRPGVGWEAIEISHGPCKGKMHWNGGGKCAVWHFPSQESEFRGHRLHQTQKPLALMLDLIPYSRTRVISWPIRSWAPGPR